MPIDLKYTLSLDDYRAAQYFHNERGVWPYLNHFTARFVLPVIGAVLIAGSVLLLSEGSLHTVAPVLLCFGIYLASYALFYRYRLRRRYQRTRTDSNERRVTFSEDVIHVEEANSSGDLKWAAAKRFSENEKVFLVYFAEAKFMILPKRMFQPGQADALRPYYNRNLHRGMRGIATNAIAYHDPLNARMTTSSALFGRRVLQESTRFAKYALPFRETSDNRWRSNICDGLWLRAGGRANGLAVDRRSQ